MRRGFTLVELLIVIAVIGALVGIAIPISWKIKEKAQRATCQGVLRGLGVSLEAYLSDHNDVMPELYMGRRNKGENSAVLETELLPYTQDKFAFECPADHRHFKKSGSSYFWNESLSGIRRDRMSFLGANVDSAAIPLIFDKEAFHGDEEGVNFLYADHSTSNKVKFEIGSRD